MTKGKPGKSGPRKPKRKRGEGAAMRELRYAGGPARILPDKASKPGPEQGPDALQDPDPAQLDGEEPLDADPRAARDGAQAAQAAPRDSGWRAADDDRWAVERLLGLLAQEQRDVRRVQARATGFFLGLPLLFGLACLARASAPVAADSGAPALRVITLLVLLAALGVWFSVLRTPVETQADPEGFGWEPREPSERRASERLVSARRRAEGQLQQARNGAARLAQRHERALLLSGVALAGMALLFVLAALG